MSTKEEKLTKLIIKKVTPFGIIVYKEGDEEKFYTPYVATNERYLALPIGKRIKDIEIESNKALYITRTPDGTKPRIEAIGLLLKRPS